LLVCDCPESVRRTRVRFGPDNPTGNNRAKSLAKDSGFIESQLQNAGMKVGNLED